MDDVEEHPIAFAARTLGPKTAVPTLPAARKQRWAVILQAYNYQVEY